MYSFSMQSTISESAEISGVELHGGKFTNLKMLPAEVNGGINFIRKDIADRNNIIKVIPSSVSSVLNCTTLSNTAGVTVSTVEHLLAALAAFGIDNINIEIDSNEVPAVDGSAEPFFKIIERAKIKQQSSPRRYVKVLKPVEISIDDSYAKIEPSDQLELDVTIDYDDKAIGIQNFKIAPNLKNFHDCIASARTFAKFDDVASLRACGLSRGGSLSNAIVVDKGKVLNSEGLRFENEFARHKTLDLMGDLYVGGPVIGRVTTFKGGHKLNHALQVALYGSSDTWKFINL
jgi:UDP-3-O-[3-hydroxymyristoyl] N-acetylglucosamine deacetylase